MTYTNDDLMKMTPDQLDALFRESPPGPIPNGAAKGTALIDTGTPISPVLAEIVRVFAWQGKTFDAASDTLVNSITFFGVSAIEAKDFRGPKPDRWKRLHHSGLLCESRNYGSNKG